MPAATTGAPTSPAGVAVAQQQYGKLEALINNAGVMPISPLDELAPGLDRGTIGCGCPGHRVRDRAARRR